MSVYHVYACDPSNGRRMVETQASVISDTSFGARKTYAALRHLPVTDCVGIRQDLDDRDSCGDTKPVAGDHHG